MRMPEPGPLGETFFEARVRAMVGALRVNNPAGGWVESVVTLATHFFLVRLALARPTIHLHRYDAEQLQLLPRRIRFPILSSVALAEEVFAISRIRICIQQEIPVER